MCRGFWCAAADGCLAPQCLACCLSAAAPSYGQLSALIICSRLNITIRNAAGLAAKDSGGTSDPYVRIKVGHEAPQQTTVKPKTLDPSWDEAFPFELRTMEDFILMEVRGPLASGAL